jgi:hypothetical protein
MLGWIDPYGTTTFNGVHMRLLLSELERIKPNRTAARPTSAPGSLSSPNLLSAAHRYLRLLGD